MNIVVSTKSYYPILGGSIVFAAMLAKAFAEAGHEVKLVTRTPGGTTEGDGYPVIRQPAFQELWQLAEWSDILLQVEASWKDALPFILKRVPWFPTVHRGKVPYRTLGLKQAALLAIESAGYQLGRSVAVADYVVDSWNLEGTSIPNPYDDSCFFPPAAGAARDIDVLFVGRVSADKGIFVLLEAIGRLAGDSAAPRISKIAIVGTGADQESLRAAATALRGVELLLPGMLPPREVGDWMRRSKVLAFPTTPLWLEASPLTPLEAVACGCRVVASDIGGTKENLGPESGLVKAGDAAELAGGIAGALAAGNPPLTEAVAKFLESRKLQPVARQYLARFENALRAE
jgi:glycosyltransferase involved in cell wall biosynthesis